MNVLFIMAALAGFKATLTLPGIAGIILTIGMSVDANVLIFERMREEIRLGKTHPGRGGRRFSKAIWTILDANVTTLIAAVVLFQFGTGPIRGFRRDPVRRHRGQPCSRPSSSRASSSTTCWSK